MQSTQMINMNNWSENCLISKNDGEMMEKTLPQHTIKVDST